MAARDKKILIVGAGAIGASIAAWLAPHYNNLHVIDKDETQKALKKNGITTYRIADPESTRETTRIKIVDNIKKIPDMDIVILAVKNYDLETAAIMVYNALGDKPLVVSMANGILNQTLLPRYFSRVIYCVVSYNARRDKPAVIGYQKKGPLYIGTPDNSLQAELQTVQEILSSGCETIITNHLENTVHSKLVINLTNALDTLVGQGYMPVSDFRVYQRLFACTLYEGVRIIRAAGYSEYPMNGMPSFLILHLGTLAPSWLAVPVFRRKVRTIVMTSMAQDILLHDTGVSEIDTLTGYIISLAKAHNVPSPYNSTIYRLAKERFRKGFKPMRCEDVMAEVHSPAEITSRQEI